METIINGIIKKVSQKNKQAAQCVIENIPIDGYKTKKKLITALDKSKPKTKQKVIECLEEKGSDDSPVKKLFAKAKKAIKGKRGRQTNDQRQMLLDNRIKYIEKELNRPLTNNELLFVRPTLSRQVSAERLKSEELQGFQEEAWKRLMEAQKYMEMVERDKDMNRAAALLQRNLKAYSSAKKESTRNKREQDVVDSTKKVDELLKKGITFKQALEGETNKEKGNEGKSKMKQAKKVKIRKMKPKEVPPSEEPLTNEVILPSEGKPVKFTPKEKKPKKDKPIKKLKPVIEPEEPVKVKFTPKEKKPKKDKPIKKLKPVIEPEEPVKVKFTPKEKKPKKDKPIKKLKPDPEAKKKLKEEKEAEKKKLKEEKEAEKKKLKEEKEAEKKREKKLRAEESSSEESTVSEPTESEPSDSEPSEPEAELTKEQRLEALGIPIDYGYAGAANNREYKKRVNAWLNKKKKKELVEAAELLGLDTIGTVPELKERITVEIKKLPTAREIRLEKEEVKSKEERRVQEEKDGEKEERFLMRREEKEQRKVPVDAPRAAEDTTGSGRFVINRGFTKVSVPHPMNTKDL